jgi:hypothetical protein
LSYWNNGFGLVSQDGKRGLIDKAGNIIGGRLFDKAERAEEGDVGTVLLDGKWVGLDRQGRIVANPKDGTVVAACPSGIKLVLQSGKVQAVGADGQPTVPYLLDFTYNKLDCDRPSPVRLDSKWGFVGTDGRMLNGPPAFEDMSSFVGGYSAVKQGGKWRIIDADGRYTVERRYDRLALAGNNLFKATEAGREYWINGIGEEQPAPERQFDRASLLKCGPDGGTINAVETPGGVLWGIVDASGQELAKRQYRAIHCFRNGVAWVPDDVKRRWCPLGPDGTVREQPACIPVRYPYVQTHSYPERFSDDPYENSVQWTRAYLEFGAAMRANPPRMIPDRAHGSFSISR